VTIASSSRWRRPRDINVAIVSNSPLSCGRRLRGAAHAESDVTTDCAVVGDGVRLCDAGASSTSWASLPVNSSSNSRKSKSTMWFSFAETLRKPPSRARRRRLRVRDDLLVYVAKLGNAASLNETACGDRVFERPPVDRGRRDRSWPAHRRDRVGTSVSTVCA